MATLIAQLTGAIGIGISFFIAWQLTVFLLPDIWPEKARKDMIFAERLTERMGACFQGKLSKFGFLHRTFHLGSPKVEDWRRQVT